MIQKLSAVGLAASAVLYVAGSFACDCVDGSPFQESSRKTELVVTGKVEGYGPKLPHGSDLYEYMKVSVLDVLAGEEKGDLLLVYGDPGNLCRPYITPDRFGLGKQYVMALRHLKGDTEPNYEVSNCGEYWLSIENGKVTVRIARDREEVMSYEAFRRLLDLPKR